MLLLLSKIFPESLAAKINRWIASVLMVLIYNMCITFPNRAKKIVKGMMYGQLKGSMSEEEFEKHFNPPYNPWEQRFCLAPQGDFFQALRSEISVAIFTGFIVPLIDLLFAGRKKHLWLQATLTSSQRMGSL